MLASGCSWILERNLLPKKLVNQTLIYGVLTRALFSVNGSRSSENRPLQKYSKRMS